jgi:cellobiose phosphorylase
MKRQNIALGFYQNVTTVKATVNQIRRNRLGRVATIEHKKDESFKIARYFPPINNSLIERFKEQVISDEILIIVDINEGKCSEVLNTLREVESGHPLTFLIRDDFGLPSELILKPSREPLTSEQLSQRASTLALELKNTTVRKVSRNLLSRRLQHLSNVLSFLQKDITESQNLEQTTPLSAEWLLDNMYIIEGSVEDVRRNLPQSYYRQLPKIICGPYKGMPRMYAIASEIVEDTAGKLTHDNLIQFIQSYQSVDPLRIGEVWALPIMLRYCIIEDLQTLAIEVDKRIRETELASYWGNRLLFLARRHPEMLDGLINELKNQVPVPSPHFGEELLDHLFDEENVLQEIRKWLEGHFSIPINEVIHQEQVNETSDQLAISNLINSLITLNQLSWQEVFEKVSAVDAILKDDPAGIYLKMNFNTRNRYRNVIEFIARRSEYSEVDIAKEVVHLSQEGKNELNRHVGYYLIDNGRNELEERTHFDPTIPQKLRKCVKTHPATSYIGLVTLLTLFFTYLLFSHLKGVGFSIGVNILLSFLSLFPISELSIQIVNFFMTKFLLPHPLAQMSYEKGIPDTYKTLVVVPTMLMSEDTVRNDLYQLEIRYLANTQDQLRFALFTDFVDSTEQTLSLDDLLLKFAIDKIKELDEKYGPGRFFLFHRKRIWSPSENAWIGWERKRGKLEILNCFLSGEPLQENIVYYGQQEKLKDVRFVITLDADTQLPKNKGRELIEVLSHPLNLPRLASNGKYIEHGYTIIQPQVSTGFSDTKKSWFTCLFAEPYVVDPYTQATSNVYQDLTNFGTYHGKGIYDVRAFNSILSHRFPDEHLLSHDLLEGEFVKTGYASNISLLDQFPEDYLTWSRRSHRWIRGDFQVMNWLFNFSPTKKGREDNPLCGMSRWKIFDNHRRALMPIALLALLLIGWVVAPFSPVLTNLVVLTIFLPFLILVVNKIIQISLKNTFWDFTDVLYSFIRSIINIALLPHEAFLSFDAIVRVFYRKLVSKQKLLQWVTSSYRGKFFNKIHQQFLVKLSLISLFSIGTIFLVDYIQRGALFDAIPIGLLWLISPLIVYFLDKPLEINPIENISEEDRAFLRFIARRTWRYYDDFVNPHTNWLPPDNYQTGLKIELAMRTSPTNIGMWLIGTLSANDFHYISIDQTIDRIMNTMGSLKKLERYEGHFLNWFNIETLYPLYPRYISTVDSGNLLACMWTLEQGLYDAADRPLLSEQVLNGLKETFKSGQFDKSLQDARLEEILFRKSEDKYEIIQIIHQAISHLKAGNDNTYWFKQIEKELTDWESIVSRYLGYIEILHAFSPEQLSKIDEKAHIWKKDALSYVPTLKSLASGNFLEHFKSFIDQAKRTDLPPDVIHLCKKLKESLETSQWFAGEKYGQMKAIIEDLHKFSEEMNLGYLYNSERKLFSIGYNIDEKRLDSSYYDLLASEARIASFVAIAKGDVPVEHWWSLSRNYSVIQGKKILLSWAGTMFEYLMPLIFNKQYRDSLLGEACYNVVVAQINYGKLRGIPWGISEAAFSAIDSQKTYQYKSFGVPGIGLKRGLEDDLVVSPYSSALALPVFTKAALSNLKRLADVHEHGMLGPYGFYESIDFTRQSSPEGRRGVIVYAFMAHHQGMILASINNILKDYVFTREFHSDPRTSGVISLLYEKVPTSPALQVTGLRKEVPLDRLLPISTKPIMGVVETPESVTPKINLLSNGQYSIMISNSGGGYSKWKDFDITRWRSDTTCDAWGNFFYIKDVQSGAYWSYAYHPTNAVSDHYSVSFKADRTEFKRRDNQIDTQTDVFVSSEDNAEVWILTFINHSSKKRELEITSYMELVLAPHATDRAHPIFNKMFIETEALENGSALLAFRRLRSHEDQPIWVGHVAVVNQHDGYAEYETDRGKFIGRGNTLQKPQALESKLSNTAGTVLDPIFSIRKKVTIEPGARIEVLYTTFATDTRESAIALVDKYKYAVAGYRAKELAWTYSQLELRHLHVQQEEVQLFQKLACRILYPHIQMRTTQEKFKNNQLNQSKLWAHGISGDLPIIVVTIGDNYDIDLVKQTLTAHTFCNMRGLKCDLVILNEEADSYEHPLFDQLQRLVQSFGHRTPLESPGGIFLRSTNEIPPEEVNLILCVAYVVLVAARGPLRQQLVSPYPSTKYPARFIPAKFGIDYPSQTLPFFELEGFNQLGGFTHDGKIYAIILGENKNTPAPWINILANSQFGCLVSETGLGCTWYGNSQSNRLTNWSNDPLLNPITDAIYIRDEEIGSVWTATPSPIREKDPYLVIHSQGFSKFEHNSHGISVILEVFVPIDDKGGLPVKIQRLKLLNTSPVKRVLTVTSYSEIILGTTKEETQTHIFTEWDVESQSLNAHNRYQIDFGTYQAFTSTVPAPDSYTCDRTEFIGRNGTLRNPAAMGRKSLSGNAGAALDPCLATQIKIELNPNEEKVIIINSGYAKNAPEAKKLIEACSSVDKVNQLFDTTVKWWDDVLSTIQVEIPGYLEKHFINRWLIHQTLSCRFWGRTAFYQSSGAYGFRDQLQDSLALVYSVPQQAREQILRSASRQFLEGDVQHWWHPQTGAGIRTRITDDLLWLPFVTAQYIRVTGDVSILDEEIPFLTAPLLTEEQTEVFSVPEVSEEKGSLLEHCRRSINKGLTSGPHRLPLMGTGDWNDGMNLVGVKGKGESIWLAWFIIHVLNDFADLLKMKGDGTSGEGYRRKAQNLADTIEESAWDGEWYLRAYFDDGTPLGSKDSPEAKIDNIAQSWSVISGYGDKNRVVKALESAYQHLVRDNVVRLLTPPFDKSDLQPGYIKGYPPGVRENGGQYTHGSLWLAKAYAMKGDGDRTINLLNMMLPTVHSYNPELCALYRVEPYVIVADIYDLPGSVGRGGWTWYSGSSAWMYRIWLEDVLGFTLRDDKLKLNPCIPIHWQEYKIHYRHHEAYYDIRVLNPISVSKGKCKIVINGKEIEGDVIPLEKIGRHSVEVTLERE